MFAAQHVTVHCSDGTSGGVVISLVLSFGAFVLCVKLALSCLLLRLSVFFRIFSINQLIAIDVAFFIAIKQPQHNTSGHQKYKLSAVESMIEDP